MRRKAFKRILLSLLLAMGFLVSWPLPLALRSLVYFEPSSLFRSLWGELEGSHLSIWFWLVQLLTLSGALFLLLSTSKLFVWLATLVSETLFQAFGCKYLTGSDSVDLVTQNNREMIQSAVFVMAIVGLLVVLIVQVVGATKSQGESD
jgi:hypothetical protein